MDVLAAMLVGALMWAGGYFVGFYAGHRAGEAEQKLRSRLDDLAGPWKKT